VCIAAGTAAAGSPGSSAQAVQLLPSLVIFGRLCLLYGQQLPAKVPLMVRMRELKTRCPGHTQRAEGSTAGAQGVNQPGICYASLR
jgi:hypothetical protein